MSFIQRAVKVPPNSASLDEARHRVFDFFRAACRSIPTIMDIYNLDDVVAPSHLRSAVSSEIRKNASVTNPKVPFSLSLYLQIIRYATVLIIWNFEQGVKCLEFHISPRRNLHFAIKLGIFLMQYSLPILYLVLNFSAKYLHKFGQKVKDRVEWEWF